MIEATRILRRSSRYGNRWYDDDGDDGTSPFLPGENRVPARGCNLLRYQFRGNTDRDW